MMMNGTFGKVLLKGSTILKNTKTCDYGSIAELIFMISHNNNKFFPSLYNFSINSTDIVLTMEYCGLTLSNLAYTLDYPNRLKLIPDLIKQINDILFYLKSIEVTHMDIKPSNICYNRDRKQLKLIDFGFVTKICGKYTTKMCGTYNFADPDHIRNKLPANYEYDTFGAGLSLYSFLNKSHIPFIKTIGINYDILLNEIGHDEHKKHLSPEIADYLKSMVHLDKKLRPIPSSEKGLCDLGYKETIGDEETIRNGDLKLAVKQLLYKSYTNENMINYAVNLYDKITHKDTIKSLGNESIILEYCTSLSLHIYEKTDVYMLKKPNKLYEFIKLLLSMNEFRKDIYP